MSYNWPSREVGKRRHAFIGGTFDDRGTDQLAFFVVQDDDGADQVRAFGAARFFAVTEAAIGSEQLLSAGGSSGIGGRTESEEFACITTAAAAPATASGGRDVLLRAENGRRKKEGEYVGRSETMHDPSTRLAARVGSYIIVICCAGVSRAVSAGRPAAWWETMLGRVYALLVAAS